MIRIKYDGTTLSRIANIPTKKASNKDHVEAFWEFAKRGMGMLVIRC